MASGRQKKRANLRDVAQLAKVSVATVSRVLNSPAVVQKDTRERVEKAIAELGFHPSAAARAINRGHSTIIGALVPTLDSDIFASTIDAIESRLRDFGLSLVVATTGEDASIEVQRAKELLNIGVEGLFLSGVTHDAALFDLISRAQVPAIVTSFYEPEFLYPTIGYDNRGAAQLALEHLIDLGHREIAVVHGPIVRNDRTRERVAGAKTTRDDVSIAYFETAPTVAGGADSVARAMEQNRSFDAFLCVADIQAFGVLFELQRRGISVPDDVSVMGVHDLPTARETTPRLSTIRLPAKEMGATAAEAMARWLEEGIVPEPICLPSALKARETTARKAN